jgi:ribonuclease VapC
MIIDSSAILAIAFQEPEARRLATAILKSNRRQMSTLNWLETMMVVEARFGASAPDDAMLLLQQLTIGTIAFDASHMQEAHEAWRRYGKGRHPAALNLTIAALMPHQKSKASPCCIRAQISRRPTS